VPFFPVAPASVPVAPGPCRQEAAATDQPPGFGSARRNLPHLRESGSAYMVTWRLRRDQPALSGSERRLVCEVLLHFDGDRYSLGP